MPRSPPIPVSTKDTVVNALEHAPLYTCMRISVAYVPRSECVGSWNKRVPCFRLPETEAVPVYMPTEATREFCLPTRSPHFGIIHLTNFCSPGGMKQYLTVIWIEVHWLLLWPHLQEFLAIWVNPSESWLLISLSISLLFLLFSLPIRKSSLFTRSQPPVCQHYLRGTLWNRNP